MILCVATDTGNTAGRRRMTTELDERLVGFGLDLDLDLEAERAEGLGSTSATTFAGAGAFLCLWNIFLTAL